MSVTNRQVVTDSCVSCDGVVELEKARQVIAQAPRVQKKRGRQQRRVSATRQKLLDAARAVFTERGLDLARIDEIAERADVGKGTFYNHFSSKEELVNEVIRSVMGDLAAVLEKRCKGITELKGLLDAMISAHIDFFCKRWEDFVLYFQGRSDLTLGQSYSGIETPFIDYLQRVEALLAGVIKHRLPQPVLRRIACAVVGFVSGYYSFAVITSSDENVDEVFNSLRGAIVASLARFIQEAAPAGESNGATGGGVP